MSYLNATLSDLIQVTRQMLNDTNTSRLVTDTLDQYCNGSNTVFKLSNPNIVISGTCRYSSDGGPITLQDPTDPVFGTFTVSPAPTGSLLVWYYYQKFTDPQTQEFVDQGLAEMGFTEASLSPDGVAPSNVPDPLFRAASHFAAKVGNQVLAQKFAETYNVTAEGVTLEKNPIYAAYRAAAKAHGDDAVSLRSDYWSNQTRSNRASFGTKSSQPTRLYRAQPRR